MLLNVTKILLFLLLANSLYAAEEITLTTDIYGTRASFVQEPPTANSDRISGTLNKEGSLSFDVHASKPSRSKALFNAMMETLLREHKVHEIFDYWIYGSNLDTFNELSDGKELTDDEQNNIAKQTWTGQMAEAWGFTEVEVTEATRAKGEAGRYIAVSAIFTKPSRSHRK